MKKYYKNVIYMVLISSLLYFKFNVSFVAGNEFNLITINTVLVGFLFTVFTILMSFLNEDIIKLYEENKELEKIYSNISTGIIFGILSVLFTIGGLCIFGQVKVEEITWLNKVCFSIEVSFFILVMKSIFMAIIDTNSIVGAIRNNRILKKRKEDANEDMKRRFNE